MTYNELKVELHELVKKDDVLNGLGTGEDEKEFKGILKGEDNPFEQIIGGVIATKMALLFADYFGVDPEQFAKIAPVLKIK